MAKRPDVPASVTQGMETQRATSAAPSLSPFRRALLDAKGYNRQYHRDLEADAEAKEQFATQTDGGMNRGDLEVQVGRPLAGQVLKMRLELLCPSVWWETSNAFPDRYLAYVRTRDETLGTIKQLVAAFPKGWMPEFSTMMFVEEDYYDKELCTMKKRVRLRTDTVPEIRGWRTVLAKFLKAGLITQHQIEVHFGFPWRSSRRWQQLVSGV